MATPAAPGTRAAETALHVAGNLAAEALERLEQLQAAILETDWTDGANEARWAALLILCDRAQGLVAGIRGYERHFGGATPGASFTAEVYRLRLLDAEHVCATRDFTSADRGVSLAASMSTG